MTRTFYTIKHKRDGIQATFPAHQGAVKAFARQWRDPDGSIPWRMFYCIEDTPGGPIEETEVNPWTGESLV